MNTDPPHSHAAVTGIVLAGGEGRRFGYRDKALLPWRQRPFISHILDGLRPQVATVAVNSASREVARLIAAPTLADPFPERRGPLAGLLAGLEYADTPLALFVPCDNPRVPPDLAMRLYRALREQRADIAYATTGADDFYLHVLIRTTLRARLRRFLESGQQAVHRWYATENTCRVLFAESPAFANINTPRALERLAQTDTPQ